MDDTKAIVRRLLDAMAVADAAAIDDVVTDDVVWWVPLSAERRGLPRPIQGRRDVVLLASGQWTKSFRPDTTTWHIDHMIAEGAFVSSMMQREAIGANGAPYRNDYNWSFRIEDGRIAEVWEVLDTAFAFEALGAEPVEHPEAVR